MQRKIGALLLVFMFVFLLVPFSAAFAYTSGGIGPGLIQGVKGVNNVDYALSGGYLNSEMTDNNLNNYATMADTRPYTNWNLGGISADKYFIKYQAGANIALNFYDASRVLVGSIAAPTNGSVVTFPRLTFKWFTIVNLSPGTTVNINEVDIYKADTLAPGVPSITNVGAANLSTSLTWTPVTDSDLKGYYVYMDGTRVNSTPITGTTYQVTGVSNNVTHSFQVTAVDTSDNESSRSAIVMSIFDTISPLAPLGLTSTPQANGSTYLEWEAAPEPDVDGYNVYQSNTKINTGKVVVSNYTVSGLKKDTNYSFAVTAYDTSGNESSKSLPIGYYIDSTAPQTVTNVQVTSYEDQANLTWQKSTSPDVVGYNVYVDGVKVNTELLTEGEYLVTGLLYDTNHSFYVTSVDVYGNESRGSNVSTVKPVPPVVPPLIPSNLQVVSADSALRVSWSINRVNTQGYNVYVNGEKVNSSLIVQNNFTVNNLINDQSYDVQITAVNDVGESDKSVIKSGTPSIKSVPDVGFKYGLADITESVGTWFGSMWVILAFTIAIPLSFVVATRVKALFV